MSYHQKVPCKNQWPIQNHCNQVSLKIETSTLHQYYTLRKKRKLCRRKIKVLKMKKHRAGYRKTVQKGKARWIHKNAN